MIQIKNSLSPFLLFKIENHDFLFDGGNGTLCKIDPIITDILSFAPKYDLKDKNDCSEIIQILKGRYKKEDLLKAIASIIESNKKGLIADTGKLYELFDREFTSQEMNSFKGNLWLNVTHSCNLSCKYCFEQSGAYNPNEQSMSIETAKKCIDYWYERINKNQNIYDIVFFGGEPLLNQEVICFSVEYINNLLKELKGKVRYSITTNGTILNDKLINLFTNNTFQINISIDGIKRIHESNRPFKSGASTFDRVLESLKELNGKVTKLSAFICLTKNDIPYFKQSVLWLWNNGISNVYGNLVFGKEQIYEYDDYACFDEQIKELAEISFINIVNGNQYVYTPFIESIKAISRKKYTCSCYLWQNGIFIFSPSGDAYKCYRFIGDERFKLGNIEDSQLNLLSKNIKKQKIEKCSGCWYQLYCGDGCPYEHDIYNGNINMPAEQLCIKSKITFRESLKLYAKLQMKYPDKLRMLLRGRADDRKQ